MDYHEFNDQRLCKKCNRTFHEILESEGKDNSLNMAECYGK